MRPRRLIPDFREKIWGSTRLSPWFPDSDRKIGEVCFDAGLPLLVKFIFTSEKLSVQVHPGDDYALAEHESCGKTEMWYVLAAEPGARIAAGFREPISKERLREASESGEIEGLLEWFEARPGDAFFIPAGTVHAIGGGLTLCEIQQNSDLTYRLYDYGRRRELHLDRAVAVSDRGRHGARRIVNRETPLVCPYFSTRLCAVESLQKFVFSHSGFLIILSGEGQIDGNQTSRGHVWALPPERTELEIGGNVTLLHASIV